MCRATRRTSGLCAKEVTLYKPSEMVRQSRSTRFVYYRMTVSTYVEWEVVFVCLHLHVCTAPIKTALLANDSEREIVCVCVSVCVRALKRLRWWRWREGFWGRDDYAHLWWMPGVYSPPPPLPFPFLLSILVMHHSTHHPPSACSSCQPPC